MWKSIISFRHSIGHTIYFIFIFIIALLFMLSCERALAELGGGEERTAESDFHWVKMDA